MFSIRKPSPVAIEEFLALQRDSTFSYPEVGATAGSLPKSYDVDRNRITLGTGFDRFRQAVRNLGEWQMFRLGWVEVWPSNAPITVGQTVAVLVRHFGFWSLNACRIVYIIDEDRR